ncbi:MAG: RdgB/HAM1 family non-canonical purine NTP pyrophosphatase [Rhodothalassiaceae bacterium]
MTRRRFSGDRLVVASHNPGKVREIADLVRPLGIDTVSAAQLALPEPEETGTSFTENAELKARSAALGADMPALADDSGLVVPALGGAPGIYSARWAGPAKDFQAAMQKLHEALGDKDPAAHFICVLSLAWPDGHVESVSGRVDGRLVWPPRGTRGFGYDPVFVAEGETATFGELDPARKHAMSHRADAFRQLMAACFSPA